MYSSASIAKVASAKSTRSLCVDIHCHCLAGVDDGPAAMPEAIELCRALVEDGVTSVIATPHQLGRFSGCNESAQIREAVSVLNDELNGRDIPLDVKPGGDVRVDECIIRLLNEDRILTLADGGRYILLELPHEIFIDIAPLLLELVSAGVVPIISHPERHCIFAQRPQVVLKWLEYGAHLQITAGSLLGLFGSTAQNSAWKFLNAGWVALVATDAHSVNSRGPCMKAAFESISQKLSLDTAQCVCIENPLSVWQGQDIRYVEYLSARKCPDGAVAGNFG